MSDVAVGTRLYARCSSVGPLRTHVIDMHMYARVLESHAVIALGPPPARQPVARPREWTVDCPTGCNHGGESVAH